MDSSNLYTNLLVIGVMIFVLYFKNYFRAVFLALKLPGPPSIPLLGHVLYILDSEKLENLGTKGSELYGPIGKCWISILPVFFVMEPQDVQVLLSTNKVSTKNMFYTLLHNFLGDGLITNSGELWKEHRKLLQPCFHNNILKVYFNAFLSSADSLLESLEGRTDVNVVPHANKFVLDVLHKTVLGIPVQKDNEQSPFRKGQLFMPYRVTRPWLLLHSLFKFTSEAKLESSHKNVLQTYTKKILDNKRKLKQSLENPDNLMDMMIEIAKTNPDFTDDDIVNEACTFMLAGQDSIGAALTFSLYFLAKHSDVQEKVVEELNNIFKGEDRPPSFEDICEMKYLEQCIKETMRLCPSVPMITRKITEDVTIGKHVLPVGSNFVVSPFATHRLPHVYPEPLKFDPERFSPENKNKIHPYAYIPFSAGPRICIGYKFAYVELKTTLSQILRKYEISLVPGHDELNLSYKITLKAKGGIWLRLNKRSMGSE